MAYEKNEDEIGALWAKHGQKGEWLSGYVTVNNVKVDVVCFRVQRGGERAPTWRVLKSRPKPQGESVSAREARETAVVDDDMPW